MQTYTFPLAGRAGWRGIIDLLRLALTCPITTNVAIESIQFIPTSTAAALTASRSQVRFTTTAGVAPPAQMVSIASSTGSPLAWTATADASWLALAAGSGSTPANLSVSINSTGLAVGVYKGSVYIASNGLAGAATTIPVTLWVLPAATIPSHPTVTAVVNAADFKSEPLSAGAWISILGLNLGGAETATRANMTVLGGASVFVCGIPSVLSYNSGPISGNSQINALVPDAVSGHTSCPVVVTAGGQTSEPTSVMIAPGVMEMFQFTTPAGQLPIVTHADYSLVGPSSAGFIPAKPGEVIIAWATGDCSAPGITVGGVAAPILFAGRVAPGLCQFNLTVPNLPAGASQLSAASSLVASVLWIGP